MSLTPLPGWPPSQLWSVSPLSVGLRGQRLQSWTAGGRAGRAQVTLVLQQNTRWPV